MSKKSLKNLTLIAGFALVLMTVFSCRKYPLPGELPGIPEKPDTSDQRPERPDKPEMPDTFCFFKVEVEVDTAAASATANPDGGVAPYEYNWSNGETTQTVENLEPGAYFVVVKDSEGCKGKGAAYIR